MSSDLDASTCIRCSEVSSHIFCEQEPVGRTAATYTVLQVESSLLMSLVSGPNFLGVVWRPTVPTSGLERGVANSFFGGFVCEGRVT